MMTLLGELIDLATLAAAKTADLSCLSGLRNKQVIISIILCCLPYSSLGSPNFDLCSTTLTCWQWR
jgi:hypothetical protein